VLARAPAGWFPALAAALWGVSVAGLQTWRVARSLGRTRGLQRKPSRTGFWGLDFFLVHKVFTGILLSAAALAWLAWLTAGS
jgi:hypothetical protein